MDNSQDNRRVNPAETAGIFSKIFFWWTRKFFTLCYKKNITKDDLFHPLTADRSSELGDKLEKEWFNECERGSTKNRRPSLLKIIIKAFYSEALKLIALQFINLSVRLCQPIVLGKFLLFFCVNSTMHTSEAYLYATLLTLIVGLNTFLSHHYYFLSFWTGMHIRIACCSLVYRKALRCRTGLRELAAGNIVNLLSNDMKRLDRVLLHLNYIFLLPFAAGAVAYQLWKTVGSAGLIGFGLVVLIVIFQGYMGKVFSTLRAKTAYETDKRIRLMDEIVSGVQIIKLYAWEKYFSIVIAKLRRQEIKIITLENFTNGIFMTLQFCIARFGLFGALTAQILLGGHLSSDTLFVLLTYFNILAIPLAFAFVWGIADVAEALVSVNRIQAFLLNEEYKPIKQVEAKEDLDALDGKTPMKSVVTISRVSASWNETNILSDITFETPKGKLIAVIGQVGSGKSSVLYAILGELPLTDGFCSVKGIVSYASQDPWMFGSTIRQNILFGSQFDEERYQKVVKVCGLQQDLKQLPQGDVTLVGERGTALSGGQKARINLARSIYRNADIYLLDDPLSAVDSHVGKILFDDCIKSYLRDKTRILVTHQLQYVQEADSIIVLNNGEIEAQGTYEEVFGDDILYTKLLGLSSMTKDENNEYENKITQKKRKISAIVKRISTQSIQCTVSEASDDENEEEGEAEGSSQQISGLSVAAEYFKAGANVCILCGVFFLFICSQLSTSGTDYWLSFWATQEERQYSQHMTEDMVTYEGHTQNLMLNNTYYGYNTTPDMTSFMPTMDTMTSLYVYIGLTLLQFSLQTLACFCLLNICMRSSEQLHNSMFNSVIHTKLHFFVCNQSGHILNRFTKDMGSVDEVIPKGLYNTMQVFMMGIGSMALVASLHYVLLVPMILLSIIFWFICQAYLRTSLQIKHLESQTKSFVFTHLQTTLQGIVTVRAFRAQEILNEEFNKHQDIHSSAWFMFLATRGAFAFFVDLLCFLYITTVIFSTLIIGQDTFGGNAGLAVTQSMSIVVLMQYGMKQFTEVANEMTSVQHIMEFIQLQEEATVNVPTEKNLPTDWPLKGGIKFENVYLRYNEKSPYVLHGITVTIKPNEKIGIVGRTGAGKSSLISALFRLAVIEGSIKIDDVDTKEIDLHFLRSKISIIPQNPILFSGTLRKNLDPFEEFSESQLWSSLEDVELKEILAEDNGLDTVVEEGGRNFSVGQRQLICLARAILRNNKILVLDEATANVDPQTDVLIQRTIRQKFFSCTVLTIAHRLNTIMDSDKILVIDRGTVMEFGHPHLLLKRRGGYFWKMVQKMGNIAEQLRKIAEENYQRISID